MKIYNLTDVSTPVLKQRHLEDQTFSVEGSDLAPGASIEVPETDREHVKAQLAFLFSCGALAADKLPDSYTAGKHKALEDKYAAIGDAKSASVEAPPKEEAATEPEVKERQTPPVPETISVPEVSEAPAPEDRLPTTDVPPARRKRDW